MQTSPRAPLPPPPHCKHPAVDLPSDPLNDAVSHLFSRAHGGSTALVDSPSGSSISYSELRSLVRCIASGIRSMGVSRGDVVLLQLPNSVYYPVVFLGVLFSGGVVTTMNPLSSASETRRQVSDCNVRLAFASSDKCEMLKALGVPAVAVPEDVRSASRDREFVEFRTLLSRKFESFERPIVKQQDTAAIVYSSGTTGVSKGVMLTHGNFIAVCELFVRFEASQYEYPTSENVYLAVLPMFHIYGMSLFVLGLLSLGSTVVVMRRFDPNEVVKAIDSGLRSLKQVSCGAAALSRKSIEDFVQTFPHVDFIQGYGMTESTAVGTRGFNTEKCRRYSSIGLLAPNMQAKVLDWKTGSFLPPGSSGELLLRGPAIMKGYLNNVDATRLMIDEDGWLHTGDIVHFDQDGFLHILDRVKEIIKYKGFQIAPADLEGVLITHPDIVDVAVTGALDEESGEIPVAFVVRRIGSNISEEAVMDYLAAQVAPYKKVRKVVFTSSIPKSAAGKILRRELKKSLTSRL
ncbi:hypothetical protein EUGRSUZ_D02624 [Eucalyptus grandis]|uniref:4-coumarate--CoA ligase n=1 Tax=Eucalyptus grandis TaxID=71139 RepID=A0A059CKP6_EUCGR|nr:hypothetical protein EUGRSUZ_D02624 [Eucalyptus grandis]